MLGLFWPDSQSDSQRLLVIVAYLLGMGDRRQRLLSDVT